jgi:hypothetical protein
MTDLRTNRKGATTVYVPPLQKMVNLVNYSSGKTSRNRKTTEKSSATVADDSFYHRIRKGNTRLFVNLIGQVKLANLHIPIPLRRMTLAPGSRIFEKYFGGLDCGFVASC